MHQSNQSKTLFTILGTPVTAEPSALAMPLSWLGLTALLAGRWEARPSLFRRLQLGGMAGLSYLIAGVTHTVGHILSARYAQAPMDRFEMKAPMPETIYLDNDISPQAHRLRAAGGPPLSLLAAGITFLLSRLAKTGSALRDFLNISAWLHLLLGGGSLSPLPVLDGGSILKWTLVERGHSPAEADAVVGRTNVVLATLLAAGALIFTLGRLVRRRPQGPHHL